MGPKGLAAGQIVLISRCPVHRRWTGVTNKCSISRLLAQDGRPRFDTGLKSPHTGAMLRPILASAALLGCLAPSTAPGQAEKAAPEVPSVRDLGNGKFEVGLVTFHQQSREISWRKYQLRVDTFCKYRIKTERLDSESELIIEMESEHVDAHLIVLPRQGRFSDQSAAVASFQTNGKSRKRIAQNPVKAG